MKTLASFATVEKPGRWQVQTVLTVQEVNELSESAIKQLQSHEQCQAIVNDLQNRLKQSQKLLAACADSADVTDSVSNLRDQHELAK